MMKYIWVSLVSVVMYAIVPVAVSAERLSYSRTGPEVFQHWFERNPSLYNVADIFKDRFGGAPRTSYYDETVRDRGGDRSVSEKSDDSIGSKDLAPSADISPSVDGDVQRQGPWWDRRSLGDPGVKDLRGMNGGGFAPPDSYTGTMRRP